MDYIRKIPILLGFGSGLLIGFIGYASKIPNNEIISNMFIGMAIFYLVGIVIRNTIKNITEAIMQKIAEREEEAKRQEEEKKKELEKAQEEEEKKKGSNIDLVADDDAEQESDDFDVLPVADFIKKELK